MRMYSAQKAYFSTAKGMHINNMTSDTTIAFRIRIPWREVMLRKLVHVKGVLNKAVDKVHKGNSQLATKAVTEILY